MKAPHEIHACADEHFIHFFTVLFMQSSKPEAQRVVVCLGFGQDYIGGEDNGREENRSNDVKMFW